MPSDEFNRAQHLYRDYANVVEEDLEDEVANQSSSKQCSKTTRRGPRGGVTTPFPLKLHQLLEDQRYPDIISWQPHGRCFILRKPQEFLTKVMTRYFKQTKLTSFQRQLNLYAFRRISSGPDKGAYYHELFLRGKNALCSHMIRMRVKGTKIKSASCPENEPNFYALPPLNVVEAISEDETVSSLNVRADQPISSNVISNGSTSESVISDHCNSSDSLCPTSDQIVSNPYAMSQRPPTVITPSFTPRVFNSQIPFISLDAAEPKPVTFEGKGFYYLDSIDPWDACTLPLQEKNMNNPDYLGLSVDPSSGQLCGFEV